jgi:hypothetical protein
MNPALIAVPIWMILMACAWALIQGAAKLRTMEDQVRAADLADVVEFAPPAAEETTSLNRQAA